MARQHACIRVPQWHCYEDRDAIGGPNSREIRHCGTGKFAPRRSSEFLNFLKFFWLLSDWLWKSEMSYWSQMGRRTRRNDYRLMNSGRSTVIGPSTMTGSRRGCGSLGSQPRQDVPGASGPGGASFSTDSPLMASVRQALLSSPDSPTADAFRSGEEGPESRGTDQLEYVMTEDETTADIGDLKAELAWERERQAALNKEGKALEIRAQIASLRAKNVAQEREIRARKQELSTPSEASDHRERSSRVSSRTSWDLGQRAQGQGRSAHTITTATDPWSRVEKLMVGLSRRRSASPSPGTSTERGPDSSDSGLSGAFSLASRNRRRGKRKSSPPMSDNGSHCNRREGGKMYSGIKDRNMETVINKQLYPHAALQQEYLWGWNGENIEFGKLSFGLFVAGEIEIIMGGGAVWTGTMRSAGCKCWRQWHTGHNMSSGQSCCIYMPQFWPRSKQVSPLGIQTLNRLKRWCWRIRGRWIGHPGWAWDNPEQVGKTQGGEAIQCTHIWSGGWQEYCVVVQGLSVWLMWSVSSSYKEHTWKGGQCETHMREMFSEGRGRMQPPRHIAKLPTQVMTQHTQTHAQHSGPPHLHIDMWMGSGGCSERGWVSQGSGLVGGPDGGRAVSEKHGCGIRWGAGMPWG